MSNQYVTISRSQNQAIALGEYAIEFIRGAGRPSSRVIDRLEQFHIDSVGCALAALGLKMNAPTVLRQEAYRYPAREQGARCFGSTSDVAPEKAVLANCSAVRELDANGTNFGYNPRLGNVAGEFGHNDFYPVAIAAAQVANLDGRTALLGMLCLDEIRGRLAECFSLKSHKIDHVLHGGIASAAVYGAMTGADPKQIESAIGLLVAHYVPFRAIRAGKQLSDSKGASAAITTEMAIQSVHRARNGFVGPADIFRNPQAVFCLFEPPQEAHSSPFDLTLAIEGDDFATMGMHFKLGIYEHQSAGAIAAIIDMMERSPKLLADRDELKSIRIEIYEPAFGIICDPHKRNPTTRQSADHSMLYLVATLLRKAYENKVAGWKDLMLLPKDFDDVAIMNPVTREIMNKIEVVHGGKSFDEKYPEGIPTQVTIDHASLGKLDSGLIMFPLGHARSNDAKLPEILGEKFVRFASYGTNQVEEWRQRSENLASKSPEETREIYSLPIL